MTFLGLIGILILIGLILWVIDKVLPPDFDPNMKRLIHVVGLVIAVLIVLAAFGLLPIDIPIPRLTHG